MKTKWFQKSARPILAACITASFAASPAWSAIITVGPTGDHATIQAAVNAAAPGDTIEVTDGTYVLSAAINITKSLTIDGASKGGVIIDASGNGNGYGISVGADNVTLRDFTVLPPIVGAVAASSGGGFAIHASYNHGVPAAAYANLTLDNITIENGNRTAFDIHGYDGVTLTNLTARNSRYGNGIQLTGCNGVTVSGCTTENNAWGGLAVYCSKAAYLNRPSTNVAISMATNSLAPTILVEDEFGLVNSAITISGATFRIDNNYAPGSAFMHLYTDGDQATALALGGVLNAKYSNTASAVTNIADGGLLVGPGMTIQSAIDAATPGAIISIADGTYNENLNLAKPLTLVSLNGRESVTIQGSQGQAIALGGGNMGTVCISSSDVKIGTSTADGVTIRGYDVSTFALEHAAVYLKSTASTGLAVVGCNLVADGEAALLSEYGSTKGIEIADNVFSGKTYVGSTVGGTSAVQYSVPNVPRSMIYFGGACRNISFHGNLVGGSVGGIIDGTSNSYYNTGATLDCTGAASGEGASIAGNTFTVPSWAALRARGSFSTVTDNVFDSSASAPLIVGTYYENAASGTFSGNSYLSGTGTSALNGDGNSTVVLPGDFSAYTMALISTPAGTTYRATGPDRTTYLPNQVTATFDDQVVTLSSLTPPVIRPVPAGYATIQAAINAANPGETVEVAAGTYNEAVTVNKDIDLIGAGSATTVINSTGTVVSIPASGSGTFISGIRTTGGARGFNLNGASNVILDGVASEGNTSFGLNFDGINSGVTLLNSSFSNNTSAGIKIASTSRVSSFLIDTCAVNGNINGLYAADGNAAFYQAGAQLEGITINHGSSFSNNSGKGIYIESMNNGLFDGISVVNSGTGTAGNTAGGIDINLKYANYSNLTIRNSFVSGCGRNYTFGGGILVKARNDGSYATNPATLGGTVLLEGLRVENNGGLPYGAGIRIGDAVQNTSPANVRIQGCAFTGNSKYAVLNVLGSGTVDATGNYWASPTGPVGLDTNGVAGAVSYSPWYNVSDSATPPALSELRYGIVSDIVIDDPQTYGDLYIAPGTTITVTPEGSLSADKMELADGSTLEVDGGSITMGGSTLAGDFTFFNDFGSINFNDDVTISGSAEGLILISDVHVANGATISVDGKLVIDGCVFDCQTSGGAYTLDVNAGADFTMARTVMTDANLNLGSGDSKVYDNRFEASLVNVAPGVTGAQVYHNLTDSLTWLADAGTGTVTSVDGWGNLTAPAGTHNDLSLDLDITTLTDLPAAGRTKDAGGNVYVQPTDSFSARLDVSKLQTRIAALEVLLGYNTSFFDASSLNLAANWDVLITGVNDASTMIGKIDGALGLSFTYPDPDGTNADQNIASVNLAGKGVEGETLFFHRVRMTGDEFGGETRLTTGGATPAYLAPFTTNSASVFLDGTAPAIAEASINGTQVQVNVGPVDVLDPSAGPLTANYTYRNGNPVILTFTASDTGLAGLDAADATADLVLSASNGTTTLSTYTVTAADAAGVVTYTVALDVPVTATNGTYDVTATVRDRSGNVSPIAALGGFKIASEVLATVELEGYAGGTRDVVFSATDGGGAVLGTWTKSVPFTGAQGTVPLENVPAGTTAISAKTAWNLRSKQNVVLSLEGVGAVSLTGADLLPGGDISGDNVVNTLDYSRLRYYWHSTTDTTADIDGNGTVTTNDYSLLKSNFYTVGDPE